MKNKFIALLLIATIIGYGISIVKNAEPVCYSTTNPFIDSIDKEYKLLYFTSESERNEKVIYIIDSLIKQRLETKKIYRHLIDSIETD